MKCGDLEDGRLAVATNCLGTWLRDASKNVVPAEHTPNTSEWKSSLQTSGQEGWSRCNPKLARIHVQHLLVMYAGQWCCTLDW